MTAPPDPEPSSAPEQAPGPEQESGGATSYALYPTGYGYPSPAPGGVPPDPPRRGGWIWILLGAGAVGVVVVVTAVVVVGLWAGGVFGGHKKMPAASASELVLDESNFPVPYLGGDFSTTDNGNPAPSVWVGRSPRDTFTPAECEQLAQPLPSGMGADQATSELTGFGRADLIYQAVVAKTSDPAIGKFDALLSSCATFSQSYTFYGREVTSRVTAHRLTVDGVAGDHLGIALSSVGESDFETQMLLGQVRGVSFMARYSDVSPADPAAGAELARIFNAQRARIEQAR